MGLIPVVSIVLILFIIIILVSSLCFFIAEKVYQAIKKKGGKSPGTWRFITFVLSFSFIATVLTALNFLTYPTGG